MAAGSDHFSVTDADALLELIYSKATGLIVVVAGQSVNFWADRYSTDEPRLSEFQPFTSRDLDLFGSIANAYRLAEEAHAKLQQPRKSSASPVIANVDVATGNVVRSVQFLRHVSGVTNAEITKNAVPFRRGEVTVYFADPITTLKAKLHNLVALEQRGRNDAKHVEILRLCVPCFLDGQLAAADETDAAAKQSLRSIQRVLKLSESTIARQIPAERQFDWKTLIPIRRLNKVRHRRIKNFRERQLAHWLARKAGSRA